MNDLDTIKAALEKVDFKNFHQYAADLLDAFNIPRSTIDRLLSKASKDSFKTPIYVYRRAIIIYDPSLKINPDLAQIRQGIEHDATSAYRLLLIINNEHVVCKDLVTETTIEFKPNNISNYVHFFFPADLWKCNT